jgi:cellulase/cellobiase CelA1
VVDLRAAFRPFVDDAASGPRRPMAEVAERAEGARRRRNRRRSAAAGLAGVAGLAAVVFAVLGTLGSGGPSGDVSTVDPAGSTSATPAAERPEDTAATSAPPPTTAAEPPEGTATSAPPVTTAAPGSPEPGEPTPTPGDPPLVALVDGVVATPTTTSSWEDGYCVQVRVENTGASPVAWKVRYALAGTIATLWNAVADDQGGGTVVFTGDDVNHDLAAGASTTFGTCVDT